MEVKVQRELALLRVLKEAGRVMNSAELTESLADQGIEVSERTVRLHLLEMDKQGFTKNMGKRGRKISERGLEELDSSRTLERVGFLSAKIDQMTYRMSFDLALRTGTVVVNTAILDRGQLEDSLREISRVFEKGMAMGDLVCLLGEGESIGDMTIPKGKLGFCTVCSVTLNGVLLKHGIPCRSRFGGLMELVRGRATRFVEIIEYEATTIDPLEVFFRAGMTNYLGAISNGNGRIGAGFREIPADGREVAVELAKKLDAVGLGGFLRIGQPSQPIFDIPVGEGRVGSVVIGGLNPTAVFEEKGVRLFSRALSGLLEFNRLFRFDELGRRLKAM